MNRSPLVSIALCTYNGAEYLSEQLDTLVNQTYKNIEIVVVDDYSTDDTFTLLKDYANRFPQFKIYKNDRNLGFSRNFERAVRLCNGELIALCDQDDIWDHQKIELQVNAIKDNVFVYHDSEFIYKNGITVNRKMSDLFNFYRGDNPEAFLFFNCVSGHTILMKKMLIDTALPLRGHFHDWWLAYVATNIGKIDFIPRSLVKYRQHDNSETNILKIEREKDNYKMSSFQSYKRTLTWLEHCNDFKENKDQAFITRIYNAYKEHAGNYFSFELGTILLKRWRSIFYMSKKPIQSKMNYLRKQFFGLKAKALFNSSWKQ